MNEAKRKKSQCQTKFQSNGFPSQIKLQTRNQFDTQSRRTNRFWFDVACRLCLNTDRWLIEDAGLDWSLILSWRSELLSENILNGTFRDSFYL